MSELYKVLIIEDEPPASKRLVNLLKKLDPNIEIIDVIDTVSSSIKFLSNFHDIDLIFLDIQLSDGLSFEIFTHVEVKVPVIFTTAFDDYALKAFKVHSIDYLLKPIEPDELVRAFDKFKDLYGQKMESSPDFESMLSKFLKPSFKERFLIKSGTEIKYIQQCEIAYFYSEDGYSHICSIDNRRYIIDYKMDQLENLIDPSSYFRINRKFLIKLDSIKKIESYFNGRYKLKLNPSFQSETIVSRERASSFKSWLDQ